MSDGSVRKEYIKLADRSDPSDQQGKNRESQASAKQAPPTSQPFASTSQQAFQGAAGGSSAGFGPQGAPDAFPGQSHQKVKLIFRQNPSSVPEQQPASAASNSQYRTRYVYRL